MKRRAFVGISSAAAVAAAATPIGAQDSAIVDEDIKLEREGETIPAYIAWPRNASPGTPSIVVVMHAWGVDASIREVVRRFARAGFAAIAPDLYSRFGAPSGDGVTDFAIFRPYLMRLERAQEAGDIRTAALWLRAKFAGTNSGVMGFCMGGRIALLAAIDDGDLFKAVCAFYGPLTGVDPAAIHIPVCGNYGARDTSIPAESVRTFAAALKVPNDFRIYDDAGHAFFDDRRASYVASAAAQAWPRTLAFFHKYLGGSAS